MPYQTNEDNLFRVGAMIFAKEAPTVQLQIRNYYQRIYYCSIAGDEPSKQKVFFERELVPQRETPNV